ncbi:unnamed protein product [Moneuplotes crassus]|uniref:Uncharacterized protein n=1 Tax=Euplotes crassus TaxID=5936 RepID=A0AAD1U3I7_EUPCR|nr:unnamed protein product [Moneuplotes crassus]
MLKLILRMDSLYFLLYSGIHSRAFLSLFCLVKVPSGFRLLFLRCVFLSLILFCISLTLFFKRVEVLALPLDKELVHVELIEDSEE